MKEFDVKCVEVRAYEIRLQARTAEEAMQRFQNLKRSGNEKVDRTVEVAEAKGDECVHG